MNQSPQFYTPRGSISSLSSSSSSLYETPLELPDEIPLDQLPWNVLENIFDRATPEDLMALSRTNSTMYAAISQAHYPRVENILRNLPERSRSVGGRINRMRLEELKTDLLPILLPLFFELFPKYVPNFVEFQSKIKDVRYRLIKSFRKELTQTESKVQFMLASKRNEQLELLVKSIGGSERLIHCLRLYQELLAFYKSLNYLDKHAHYDKIEGKMLQLRVQAVEFLKKWKVQAINGHFFYALLHKDPKIPNAILPFEKGDTFYVIADLNLPEFEPWGQHYLLVRDGRESQAEHHYGLVKREMFPEL